MIQFHNDNLIHSQLECAITFLLHICIFMCQYTYTPAYTYVVNCFTHCTGMHYILSSDIITIKLYYNSLSVFLGCWCVQMSWSVRFRFLREDPRFVPCMIRCIQKKPRLPLQQSMLFMLENTAASISLCSSCLKILLSVSVYAIHA